MNFDLVKAYWSGCRISLCHLETASWSSHQKQKCAVWVVLICYVNEHCDQIKGITDVITGGLTVRSLEKICCHEGQKCCMLGDWLR